MNTLQRRAAEEEDEDNEADGDDDEEENNEGKREEREDDENDLEEMDEDELYETLMFGKVDAWSKKYGKSKSKYNNVDDLDEGDDLDGGRMDMNREDLDEEEKTHQN